MTLNDADGPLAGMLQEIVENRRRRVVESAQTLVALPRETEAAPRTAANNPFLAALQRHRGRAVIAEIKLGSPRLGSLVDRIDPEVQARTYAKNGAAALSVVVEPDYFHGDYDLVSACREAAGGLPALAKDFVVDSLQLHWARLAGADAVLLLAALHDTEGLWRLAQEARRLGLVPLIETHGAADLETLGDHPWELVGVNNRDLRTFEVDLDHSIAQVPRLPAGALKVAESGIRTGADIDRLAAAGFDAFLVGESLLLADDPGAQLRQLLAPEGSHGA